MEDKGKMIKANSANEAWIKILRALKAEGDEVSPRGLKIKEIRNCSVCIMEPKKRLITNPIRQMSLPYAFGELIWYLTGDNKLETMQYYSKRMKNFSDDGETLNSAYGYRIFGKHEKIGFDQWENVVRLLKEDRDSRQAIVHLHTPNNQKTKDEVCTLTLQFMIRHDKLEMFVNMRSNDVVWGFTYDMFNFTIIQELIANELGIEVGLYYHNAASMHIYEKDWNMLEDIEKYADELEYIYPRFDFEFSMNGLTLKDPQLLRLFKIEEDYRLNGPASGRHTFDYNDTLTKIADILFKYSSYKRGLALEYKYDDVFDLMFMSHLVAKKSKGKTDMVIFEGADGTGKSYLSKQKMDKMGAGLLLHFDKPAKGFDKYIYFHVALLKVPVVLDRFYMSELVYSDVYGRQCLLDYMDVNCLEELMTKREADVRVLVVKNKQLIEKRLKSRGEEVCGYCLDRINEGYKELGECYGYELIEI